MSRFIDELIKLIRGNAEIKGVSEMDLIARDLDRGATKELK